MKRFACHPGRKDGDPRRATSYAAGIVISAIVAVLLGPTSVAKDSIPDRLFAGRTPPPPYPAAPQGSRDRVIYPPNEEMYFPTRSDGLPYVLNVDRTVNLTEALNQFYYNPKWRGEVWTPFDQFETIERASRLMSTWREYDEFSELRIFNGWHKFWEKWSGYGP